MKYIFLINLAVILSAASSCTKDNTVQDQNPGPIISNNTPSNNNPGVTFDTINIVLTEWYQLPDNKYRSVVTIPSQPGYNSANENLQLSINYLGRYQPITTNPIKYLGGGLWYENYPGENALFFQYNGGNLPFDSLELSAIITLQRH
jgi:hypothetical protein